MPHHPFSNQTLSNPKGINLWDVALLVLIFSAILLVVWNIQQIASPYHVGQSMHVSLDPRHLPTYAVRSIFRLLMGLCCSLLFTFVVGTLAAKNKTAERVIIPAIDVLQSIPPLGFLSLVAISLIQLFPHSLLGVECASIFTVFTAQVWNITLNFYQSLRAIPHELCEASAMFQLSAWQRFWRLEVPFATPGLLWNAMVSMSASWFFVVASEAMTVSGQTIMLPGIGSYIALAIEQSNLQAIYRAIFAMFIVILIYDQLLFRPMLLWAEKFKCSESDDDVVFGSWLVRLFQRTKLMKTILSSIRRCIGTIINSLFVSSPAMLPSKLSSYTVPKGLRRPVGWLASIILWGSICLSLGWLALFLIKVSHLVEIKKVFFFGLLTAARVMSLIIASIIIWLPIGVWIGMRPKWIAWIQPMIQFLAAFPANVLFPLVTIVIVRYALNPEIWTSPLMILGTQWYILFNVIAGVRALPRELHQSTALFGVKRWLWWRRFILPGIAPYLVTGAMSAAGGAWNASMIAEVIRWGDIHLQATGLGAYMTMAASQGHFDKLAIGLFVMCLYVLLINGVIWRPLYRWLSRQTGSIT